MADIAVYHEDSFKADTVYTYIEPRTYSNIYSVNQFQPTSPPSKALRQTSPNETSTNVYEELQATSRGTYDVTKPLHEVGGELKSFFQEKSRLSRPVPPVPVSGSSDKQGNESLSPPLPRRHPNTKVSGTPSIAPKRKTIQNPYVNEIPRGEFVPWALYILGCTDQFGD